MIAAGWKPTFSRRGIENSSPLACPAHQHISATEKALAASKRVMHSVRQSVSSCSGRWTLANVRVGTQGLKAALFNSIGDFLGLIEQFVSFCNELQAPQCLI